jgi:hypothetical protein
MIAYDIYIRISCDTKTYVRHIERNSIMAIPLVNNTLYLGKISAEKVDGHTQRFMR